MKRIIFFVFSLMIGIALLSGSTQDVEQINGNLRGAIIKGDLEYIRTLISAGADVNHRFKIGRSKDLTPLYLAVGFGHADICQLLIDAGALVKVEIKATGKGSTLMHVAAASPSGNKAVINLLVANGLDANIKSKKLLPPVCLAVLKGTVEALEALIENGADLNVYYPWSGPGATMLTPLHDAVLNDWQERAALLIKGGANVNALSGNGESPLDMAMNNGRPEIEKLLREHGAITHKKR